MTARKKKAAVIEKGLRFIAIASDGGYSEAVSAPSTNVDSAIKEALDKFEDSTGYTHEDADLVVYTVIAVTKYDVERPVKVVAKPITTTNYV